MKLFIKLFLTLIASLLLSLGMVVLFLRLRLENSSIYLNAINSSEIYSAFENPSVFFSQENEAAGLLLDPLAENLDLKSIAEATITNNISYLVEWIKGDKLYIYFPIDYITQTINSQEFRDDSIAAFDNAFYSLPECTDKDLQELEARINQEETFLPNCRPANSEAVYEQQRDEFEKRINEIFADENNIYIILEETGLDSFNEKTPIETVIEKVPEPDRRAKMRNTLNYVETGFSFSRIFPIISVISGLLIVLLASLFAGKKIRFVTGVLLVNAIIVSGIFVTLYFLISYGINQISEAQTDTDRQELLAAIDSGIHILRSLANSFLLSGAFVFGGIGLFFLAIRVLLAFQHKHQKQ